GLDINTQNFAGSTALDHAAYYGNEDGVRFLLAAGADPAVGAGDEVCGCVKAIGDADLRQCAQGACETAQQVAAIQELLGRGNGPPGPAPPTTADGAVVTEDCHSLPTVLQILECRALSG
ncbi:unnamed protein product, partial [Ostreobium quekettii]